MEVSESLIGAFHEEVIKALNEVAKDRVSKVQTAAKEALIIWRKIKDIFVNIQKAKTSSSGKFVDPDELIRIRTSKDNVRLSKFINKFK